jgi:hypothetical protein
MGLAPGTIWHMSGGRVYADKPKNTTTSAPSPVSRPRSQFAPERRGWDPSRDEAKPRARDSVIDRSGSGVPHFDLTKISIRRPDGAPSGSVARGSLASVLAPGEEQSDTAPGFPRERIPAPPVPVQAKLDVGAVDDPLEKEADRVADRVMRMPALASATGEPTAAPVGETLRRECSGCHEEEKIHRKLGGASVAAMAAPPIVHDVLRSPGKPVDASIRMFMEPRFGRDFRDVRVHAGPREAEANADVPTSRHLRADRSWCDNARSGSADRTFSARAAG